MKQTYEQRVRELAERMYRDVRLLKKDSPIGKIDWAVYGETYLQYARMAVAEMAELARAAFNAGFTLADSEGRAWDYADFLKEQGLIPDDGQTFDPEKEAQAISVSSQLFGGQRLESMYYKKIRTRNRLPAATDYYAVETDVIIGYAHWSEEQKIWTLPCGTIWEATHPNYWLSPFKLNKIRTGHLRNILNQYLREEITLSRFAEIINQVITGQEAGSDGNM
jgi:hypothetical protein